MLKPSLFLLSLLFSFSSCHDDHSHSYSHYANNAGLANIASSGAIGLNTGHTHYASPSSLIASSGAAALNTGHTHYVEPSALVAASGVDNMHTHYFNPNPAPAPLPAPVLPAPVPQPQVVQDVLTLSLKPIRRPAPVVEAPPVKKMRVRRRRKTKALYKDPPLPYLPGYKWNNYTQKREK